jgi:hypothetical protein
LLKDYNQYYQAKPGSVSSGHDSVCPLPFVTLHYYCILQNLMKKPDESLIIGSNRKDDLIHIDKSIPLEGGYRTLL